LTGFNIRQAAAYITRANRPSWMTAGVSNPRLDPAEVPIMPNRPNTRATRVSTKPRRQLPTAAMLAVTATTPRLMAMADLCSTCKR